MTASFDFDSIQTVDDLVKQNEDVQSPLSAALTALEDCDYSASLLVVGYLLSNMIEYHHTQVFECDHGKAVTAYHAYTEGKLKSIKEALLPMIESVMEEATEDEEQDEEQTQE